MSFILKGTKDLFCKVFQVDESVGIQKNVKDYVNATINDNKVAIFSKSYCPYCIKAKDLLDDLNIEYKAVELNDRDDGNEIQKFLAELTNQRTVPNIFVNHTHLGGSDKLFTEHKTGGLNKLLNDVQNKE